MGSVSKNGFLVVGLVIGLAGGLALAIPAFSTAQTKDVVKIGEIGRASCRERVSSEV